MALDTIQAALSGQDLQAALDARAHQSAKAGHDPRDTALATQLAYGYLRLKGRIDFILDTFLNTPGKLPEGLRLALGVAAYELLHLDKIPAYASLDWAVEYAKSVSPGLGRLANGVLRQIDRSRDATGDEAFFRQDSPAPEIFLRRYYSCPSWIPRLWLKAYGEQATRTMLAASLQAPPVGLRVNMLRPGARSLYETLAAMPGCLRAEWPSVAIEPSGMPEDLDGLLRRGEVSRQSAASHNALAALLPTDGKGPAWDACAGRGGKTCLLLERGLTPMLASDMSMARLRGLRTELTRLGVDDCLVFRANAALPPAISRQLPLVLLDVPCSGLGVISRRPDLKWKRRETDLPRLLRLQAQILEQTSRVLAPGGALIYLTCTRNPEENERQIAAFLARHPDMRQESTHGADIDVTLGEFFWGATLRKR